MGSLGASVVFVGVIEGVAEAIASFTKLWAGYYSDKWKIRQPFVLIGYILSNFLRPFIGAAFSPWHVFWIRFGDRLGKGIRTAPRDAWLSKFTIPTNRGWIYGFHRGMDHLGAALAPLLTMAFLFYFPGEYRTLFFLTIIPGILSLYFVFAAMRADPSPKMEVPGTEKEVISLKTLKDLPPRFQLFIGILFLFTLSCATDAFLILRLTEIGISNVYIPALWAAFNVVKMLTSFWGGKLSDRIGRRHTVLSGWLIYAASFVSFGFIENSVVFILILLVYGFYYGLAEAGEKALVVDLVPMKLRGSAFGVYHLIVGIGSLPASAIFGLLWSKYNSAVAFVTAGILAFLASAFLYLNLKFYPTQREMENLRTH